MAKHLYITRRFICYILCRAVASTVENVTVVLNKTVNSNVTIKVVSNSTTNTTTSCYDDFFCEPEDQARLHFLVYGAVFALICTAGLVLNIACLVGFNKSTNRTGATLYFSAIALMDCIYLGIKLALRASFHLSDTAYAGQEKAYAERVAYFIPGSIPLLTFSELASVSASTIYFPLITK